MMFYEVMVSPHHAGFGMWQAGEANGEGWAFAEDLIDAIAQQVYEMIELGGPDPLDAEVEDIRGSIYGEPARIFAIRRTEDANVEWIGIVEKD